MQINNTIIDRIIGPISFTLLEPKNKKFPFIILFGDEHIRPVDYSKNFTEIPKTYFVIDSDEFLQLLNSLAYEYDIDFNIEYFFNEDDIIAMETNDISKINLDIYKNKNFLQRLIEKTRICHFKDLKNESNCIAPNLRWHYSDIRNNKKI